MDMLKWACSIGYKKALSIIIDFSNINMFQGKKIKYNFMRIIISWWNKHVINNVLRFEYYNQYNKGTQQGEFYSLEQIPFFYSRAFMHQSHVIKLFSTKS